jgi:hypothetical protein
LTKKMLPWHFSPLPTPGSRSFLHCFPKYLRNAGNGNFPFGFKNHRDAGLTLRGLVMEAPQCGFPTASPYIPLLGDPRGRKK